MTYGFSIGYETVGAYQGHRLVVVNHDGQAIRGYEFQSGDPLSYVKAVAGEMPTIGRVTLIRTFERPELHMAVKSKTLPELIDTWRE